MNNLPTTVLEAMVKRFIAYKELGERAFGQLDDQKIHWKQGPEDNTIYVIVQHMHGNMVSRFTDFLDSDGEKPDRRRDEEFRSRPEGMAGMRRLWDEGWDCVLNALKPLRDRELQNVVTIRGEPHSVCDALLRQIGHYAYHVGQIVYIAKTIQGMEWQNLSVPKEQSGEYNQAMRGKFDPKK